MPELSVHTCTYIYQCSFINYTHLMNSIQNLPSGKYHNKQVYSTTTYKTDDSIEISTKRTNVLRDSGINEIAFITFSVSQQIMNRFVKFRINPRRLLGYNDHPFTQIIGADRLNEIPDAIEKNILALCPDIPSITKTGKFNRIDYCLNFWFNTQTEAEEYMNLLKKARIPKGFTLHTERDSKQHRSLSGPNDVTIHCKSYDISLYLKQPQMISRKTDYKYPDDEIENAEGQLRIELRASRRKLYYDKKSCGCTENEIITIPSDNPLRTILKKVKSMYGIGDFFRFDDACKIIVDSTYTEKVKQELIHILYTVKKRRGLDPKKNGLDVDYLKKYMKYFDKLQLSPITLPKKSMNEFYPNPGKYILGIENNYLKSDCNNSDYHT